MTEAVPRGPDDCAKSNLVLCGYRGCGKSSVGRLLSQRLGWELVDTDELVAKVAGHGIARIFAEEGEPAFRRMESAAIARVVAGRQRVISVGGGAVLSQRNRAWLKTAGLCIWLTAPPEELYRRIQADPRSAVQRPALTAAPELSEVRQVLASREPLYQELADHTVDTTGRGVEEVVEVIMKICETIGLTGAS
ncbi:MAG: shikimate kinase [Planctomycetota bacterium]